MSLPPPDPKRCEQLMREAIEAFGLDLAGLTVLTEAASGPFVVTPLLAALAGAEEVLALTAPSRHATVEQVTTLTRDYAARYGVDRRIAVITDRADKRLAEVGPATNLGFVRPLDRELLERLGPGAAVSLMCEPWELRPGDVDLEACRALGIPTLGTDEDDGRLRMFDYLPVLARKLLDELDVELRDARLVLVSAGRFTAALERGLAAMGAEVACFAPGDAAFEAAVRDADAIVIADYPGSGPILGPHAPFTAGDLRASNPTLALAHIAGDVVLEDDERGRIAYAPERIAPAGTMSVTAGELGPRPVVNLHCAGLRVGAELSRARQRGLAAADAEREVLAKLPLAMGPPATEEATA